MDTNNANAALRAHQGRECQVWVADAQGTPLYVYRTGLPYLAAKNWAASWTSNPPADVPGNATFVAVVATTTYTVA